jgi:hypothetical protein
MDYKEREKDPRWKRAGELFDSNVVPLARWNSSHGQAWLRFAVCSSALSPEESGYGDRHATLLENTVKQYFRDPAAVTRILTECESVVRSAKLTGKT